jgi:hypothetical protein
MNLGLRAKRNSFCIECIGTLEWCGRLIVVKFMAIVVDYYWSSCLLGSLASITGCS